MMKKIYQSPKINKLTLACEDVITASGIIPSLMDQNDNTIEDDFALKI